MAIHLILMKDASINRCGTRGGGCKLHEIIKLSGLAMYPRKLVMPFCPLNSSGGDRGSVTKIYISQENAGLFNNKCLL